MKNNLSLVLLMLLAVAFGCIAIGLFIGTNARHNGDGLAVVLIRNSIIDVNKVAVIYGVKEEGGNMAACELLRDDLTEQFGTELSCVYEKALK